MAGQPRKLALWRPTIPRRNRDAREAPRASGEARPDVDARLDRRLQRRPCALEQAEAGDGDQPDVEQLLHPQGPERAPGRAT